MHVWMEVKTKGCHNKVAHAGVVVCAHITSIVNHRVNEEVLMANVG